MGRIWCHPPGPQVRACTNVARFASSGGSFRQPRLQHAFAQVLGIGGVFVVGHLRLQAEVRFATEDFGGLGSSFVESSKLCQAGGLAGHLPR